MGMCMSHISMPVLAWPWSNCDSISHSHVWPMSWPMHHPFPVTWSLVVCIPRHGERLSCRILVVHRPFAGVLWHVLVHQIRSCTMAFVPTHAHLLHVSMV